MMIVSSEESAEDERDLKHESRDNRKRKLIMKMFYIERRWATDCDTLIGVDWDWLINLFLSCDADTQA